MWVKKLVENKEWTDKFEKDGGYWMLSKVDGGVWIGFLTTNTESLLAKLNNGELELQSDEELRISDLYRRANNMRPYPLLKDWEINWEKNWKAEHGTN
jgi:hypothetical protein